MVSLVDSPQFRYIMKVAAVFALATTALIQAHAKIEPLIMGGTIVPAGEKTYTVGLRTLASSTDVCGGTLISPFHVLTAAHCSGYANYVSIGTHYLSGSMDGERIRVKQEFIHPKWNRPTMDNDYLILELWSPSTFPPIPLYAPDAETFAGSIATALGWGTASYFSNAMSNELQRVDVPVVSHAACVAAGLTFNISDSMMCAGGEQNMDSCKGDSGGPLILEQATGDVLVGVVSWGDFCGDSGKPAVYSKVSYAKDWIKSIVPPAKWIEPRKPPVCPDASA